MKLVNCKFSDQYRVGMFSPDSQKVHLLELSLSHPSLGIVAAIDAQLSGVALESLINTDETVALDQIEILAPIPRPHRNVFCVGLNYRAHAKEVASTGLDAAGSGDGLPEAPIIFTKVPESVIRHGADIEYDPTVSEAIDYEVEFAVIIGTPGHRIARSDAMNHVWGYTVINDVTARDWQKRHQQWHLGKSFPTFCPMGPVAVTADEIDPADAVVRTTVNDEIRQESSTSDLIFNVPTLIECISAAVPLVTGDIIATGTPAGVGMGFHPPKYLKDGDRVMVEVEGIGQLENTVRRMPES